MSRRILGPFNRVEGDLEVHIEADADKVLSAKVNSPLFRGFEAILHGKPPTDALVYTPRICGICSVSQSVAAANALAQAAGIAPQANGGLATQLTLAAENLADHLSHFYLFFMPDFARDCYSKQPWHTAIAERFRAQSGNAGAQVLAARAQFLNSTAILAGKWPHSLALQPGGTTAAVDAQGKTRLLTLIASFRLFLQQVLFGDELEAIGELHNEAALHSWAEQHPQSDFARFLQLADTLGLQQLGRGHDRFLSYGAYQDEDQTLFAPGVWQAGAVHPLNPDDIHEDISHSWMAGQNGAKHPFQGSTIPDAEQPQGYSWCKAPRLNGHAMEVGALARQQVDGHPLIRDLVANSGGNVRNRVIARLLELALVVPHMQQWAQALQPGQPFCTPLSLPDDCEGAGLVEAARGSLGHWLRVRKGRILNYQIIAPTTWNFSPRDAQGLTGPLEQALQDTPASDPALAEIHIQHIIRSFDPCMVCTVH